MEDTASRKPKDMSPDRDDRIRDFFVRHGGPSGKASREGETESGIKGWSEVYALDGYALRCDWSRIGSSEHMTYSEIAAGADP